MLWTQIAYVKCFQVRELGCDIIDMCTGTFTKATGEDYSVEPTDSRRPFRFVLDVDLIRTSTGNRVFGALKGALDGGLDVPHSEKRFAGFKKDDKQLDAEMHHNYIFGGHVANHMRYMIEEDQRNTTHTSVGTSSKQGVDANNMEEVYKKVHAAIRADPMLVKSTKEPPKENKRFNLKKHTYDERKKGLIERMNALNERAGADDMDDDDDDDEDDE